MGKVTGFLEIDRSDRRYEPAGDRVRHFREFVIPLGEEGTRKQAARCMDCHTERRLGVHYWPSYNLVSVPAIV